MIRQCVICGKEFSAIPARINAKLCSNACRYIYQGMTRRGENNGRWTGPDRVKPCQHCGKQFRWNVPERKFCSMECTAIGQKRMYGKDHYRHNAASRARGAQSNSKIQQKWAAAVILRDDATCRHCGITDVKMNAHHIKPWKQYPELRADVANGITLCVKCHRAVHSKAAKENSVNSVNTQTGKAVGNTEPSASRKIREGVTARGRARTGGKFPQERGTRKR